MKLFTSDLDRTLIFSERTKLAEQDYECIEQLDGRNISYISQTTRTLLEEVTGQLAFVPVTTRSFKQYQRLTFFHQELQPELAIIANGGIILRRGKVDEVWQQQMMKQMAALPVSLEQLPKQFEHWFSADFVVRKNELDALFFVLIVDAQKASSVMTQLQQELQQVQWTCYLQGKKLYVMPQFLTKGAAVQHIKDQQRYVWHAAAGDSVMDLSMLVLADACYIPLHAELAQNEAQHGLPIMQAASSDFTEACLRHILATINQEKETGTW